ncbi:MAG: ribonuclease Y [Planctomycetaceae bacterium]|jgi:ribonuclease Y
MTTTGWLFVTLVSALVGLAAGWLFERLIRGAAYQQRDQILSQARTDAETLRKSQDLAAKEDLLKRRESLERELGAVRDELREQERRLDRRDTVLTEQQQDMSKKERMVEITQKKLAEKLEQSDARDTELQQTLRQQQDQLFRISGMTADQAREQLFTRLEQELKGETGAMILKHEQELKQNADRLAREIIGMAVQRYAAAHTSETTVSSVDIPNDEMKGRIIGREGRNIRAFEKSTGVDVIVDDTPGVVIVSAFDAVRREVARLSLVKLIQDGRIHPTRIEEIVAETQKEIDAQIRRAGREGAQEVGVHGLHEKLVELMGRLSFRTSYSQNVLRHSIEVSFLTGLLAEQLNLDGNLARRCGFLHDIGKAADHEMEGGHPTVGAELLKRYGERAEVVHAARGHHDDIRVDYIYTVLVAAADAISAARPGARRESLERYIKRLEDLEALACGFPGVEQAFAVQAGREIRIVVNPRQINDREAARLCRDIAQAIEESLTYPGEIKVNVLRETRHIETAR